MRRILVFSIWGVCACTAAPATMKTVEPGNSGAVPTSAPAENPVSARTEVASVSPFKAEPVVEPMEAMASKPKEEPVSESAPGTVVSKPVEKITYTFVVPDWTDERESFIEWLRNTCETSVPGAIVEIQDGDEFDVSIVGLPPHKIKEEKEGWQLDWNDWHMEYPEAEDSL